MTWLIPATIATLAGSLVLTLVYIYLITQEQARYLRIWTLAWGAYAVRLVFDLLLAVGYTSLLWSISSQSFALLNSLFILWGTYALIRQKIPVVWLVGVGVCVLWIIFGAFWQFPFMLYALPSFAFAALIHIKAGLIFMQTRTLTGIGSRVTGIALVLWGVHKANFPFLRPVIWFAPWGYLLSAVLALVVALGTLLVYFQKTREELRESRDFLENLIASMQDGLVILDAQGRHLTVNDAFCRMTGYSREELLDLVPPHPYWPPEALNQIQAAFDKTLNGQFDHFELTFKRKNGGRFPAIVSPSWVKDKEGNIISYFALVKDITERKRLEEQLLHSQKMDAIGQLTAGIAHDFNNMLTAINGFAELMQMEMATDDPHQESITKILRSGRRAADLVQQLLAFSRKQVIEPRIININDTVAKMDKMLQRIIGENIELKTMLASDLWEINMDPVQLEQVIINLAVNARDAMPQGGCLTIETANVVLDDDYVSHHLETQPGEHVMLTVTDTGHGMTNGVKIHIFEPFFTTKEWDKGTGLGLSTVFGIVKQNGGHIWVFSEENKGAVFKVYLPKAKEEWGKSPELLQKPANTGMFPAGSETILLVEDDNHVRELARRVLTRSGFKLLEAANGQEALQLVGAHQGAIDLLLADVIMPGISGKVLAEQLTRQQPNLKVLFISGYTDNAIIHHGVLDPGINLLQKPFNPQALLAKIREVLDK